MVCATWAAVEYLARRAGSRVREAGEAHRKSAGNERGSRGRRVKRKNLWGPSGKHTGWRCEPLSFAYFSLRRQRKVGASLSAFLWARRLKESLAARLRKPIAKQNSKLVHG